MYSWINAIFTVINNAQKVAVQMQMNEKDANESAQY